MKSKKIRIGFDLDGVIIGKPLFVPIVLMEKLVRESKNSILSYRFPKSDLEIRLRIISHYPIFRPPIVKNINLIRDLYKSGRYEILAVSSRYRFLEKATRNWFRFYNLDGLFSKIYINKRNEQPHLYKAKMIKRLKLEVFIDDDAPLLDYLRKQIKGVEFIFVEGEKGISIKTK